MRAVNVFGDGRGWYGNVGDRIYAELGRSPVAFSDVFAFVVSDATSAWHRCDRARARRSA